MLKPLQPGIEPIGQFDIEDGDRTSVHGGEVGILEALEVTTDYYAADVGDVGPQVQVTLSNATAQQFYGLCDDGTSEGGEGVASYGTLFGTVIGITTGQGTGFGTQNTTNIQVVGPDTMTGSGKVTMWTKPGLYGVTVHGWESAVLFNAATLNTLLYGDTTNATRGKMTTDADGGNNGVAVGVFINFVTDYSLVSTTNAAAGETTERQYGAMYLYGMSA